MHLKFIPALCVRGRNCYPHFTDGKQTNLRRRKNGWHRLICSGFPPYIRIHTFTHVYTYVCIYVYIHSHMCIHMYVYTASQVAPMVKIACRAGDARGAGSVPGREDPLEEEMAPHSSILAWKIPWTEEHFFFFFAVKSLEGYHLTTPRVFAHLIIACPLFHI